MRRNPATALLLAVLPIVAADAATAAGRCGVRERIVERLEHRYGETQRAYGLAEGRGLIEVFASDTGTWTILLTSPGGRSCLMAAGRHFQSVEPRQTGQPS